MFFHVIDTMKRYRIDEFLSSKLDVWLGTRRRAVRKFLSPLQFSLDTNIDEETAIALFAICTERDIDLLKQRFVVECCVCNRYLGSYSLPNEIPQEIYCMECNSTFNVTTDMISIWFELTKTPELQDFQKYVEIASSGEDLGKDLSLRPDRLAKSQNQLVRGLLRGWNERFRTT